MQHILDMLTRDANLMALMVNELAKRLKLLDTEMVSSGQNGERRHHWAQEEAVVPLVFANHKIELPLVVPKRM